VFLGKGEIATFFERRVDRGGISTPIIPKFTFMRKNMDKHLTRKIGSFGILTALLTMSIGHGMALADIPGNHPAYLHARSDLRRADRLLNAGGERNVVRDMQTADYEIDAAIREIDRAAILDHKDVDDKPQVDVSQNPVGRLHQVLRLLDSARHDLSQTEDNRYARGWRSRAAYHVNRAIDFTNRSIHDYAADNRYRRY